MDKGKLLMKLLFVCLYWNVVQLRFLRLKRIIYEEGSKVDVTTNHGLNHISNRIIVLRAQMHGKTFENLSLLISSARIDVDVWCFLDYLSYDPNNKVKKGCMWYIYRQAPTSQPPPAPATPTPPLVIKWTFNTDANECVKPGRMKKCLSIGDN